MNSSTRKKHKKHKINNRKKTRKSKIFRTYKISRGGSVIDSGGFGCIFYPALRCKNTNHRTKGISKLLFKNHGIEEWKILEGVKQIVMTIPNYEKYFLLDNISTCAPNLLTNNDLSKLDDCFNLISHNITRNNINNKLNDLQLINQPYGGKTLNTVIKDIIINFDTLNSLLLKLLLHAIIPMNKKGLYHFDIKGANILYQKLYQKKKVKLIDWGESGISTHNMIIPLKIRYRQIQYNLPFSIILFSPLFKGYLYKTLLKDKSINLNSPNLFNQLRVVVKNFYLKWKLLNNLGHEDYISNHLLLPILKLYKIINISNQNIFLNLLSAYCAKILMKYIIFSTGLFNETDYFIEIFSKNCDIYGIIITYYECVLVDYFDLRNRERYNAHIIKILVKYCLGTKYAAQPINIHKLKNDLHSITSN